MFLWAVAAKSGSCDLEFLGSIAERDEAQDPQKDTNSFGADIFDCANIDGLTVVTEPVPKVDLLISAGEYFTPIEVMTLLVSHQAW